MCRKFIQVTLSTTIPIVNFKQRFQKSACKKVYRYRVKLCEGREETDRNYQRNEREGEGRDKRE